MLGEMEERGEAEHREVCVVMKDMIVNDCMKNKESLVSLTDCLACN